MIRVPKVVITFALLAVSALAVTACGTQRISVAKTDVPQYNGAVLFAQRCSGCHTLSYAGTHGSATNIRDRQPINGPNFNVRCERPIDRVLYAIENGGFSGAYMPQNIVVGQQARDVAEFVSEYAGRAAPSEPNQIPCSQQKIGTLPPATNSGVPVAEVTPTSTSTGTTTTGTTTTDTSATSTAVTGGASATPTDTTTTP